MREQKPHVCLLDGTSNGIGRGTLSSALLGRLQQSERACTAGFLDVSATLFRRKQRAISREAGGACSHVHTVWG